MNQLRNFAAAMLLAVGASASAIQAFDNAAQAAYDDGSQAGDNGGSGFLPWELSTFFNNSSTGGHFVGSSNFNGATTLPGIDSAGRSWGTFANSFNSAFAKRQFASGSMNVGDTFSLSYDNGFINNGQDVSLEYRSATETTALSFYFLGGSATYKLSDASGTVDTGIGFTDGGLDLAMTILGGGGYSISVKRLSDNTIFNHTGTLRFGVQSIDRFAFQNNNAGSNSPHDAFINNLQVVPEPASMVALGLGAMKLIRRKKR